MYLKQSCYICLPIFAMHVHWPNKKLLATCSLSFQVCNSYERVESFLVPFFCRFTALLLSTFCLWALNGMGYYSNCPCGSIPGYIAYQSFPCSLGRWILRLLQVTRPLCQRQWKRMTWKIRSIHSHLPCYMSINCFKLYTPHSFVLFQVTQEALDAAAVANGKFKVCPRLGCNLHSLQQSWQLIQSLLLLRLFLGKASVLMARQRI